MDHILTLSYQVLELEILRLDCITVEVEIEPFTTYVYKFIISLNYSKSYQFHLKLISFSFYLSRRSFICNLFIISVSFSFIFSLLQGFHVISYLVPFQFYPVQLVSFVFIVASYIQFLKLEKYKSL